MLTNILANHKVALLIFILSIALVIYAFRPSHSIWLKIFSTIFCVFMLLALIGFGTETQTGGQNLGNEAGRQQSVVSSPTIGFFAKLFNDTGSSNPVGDLTSAIQKQFDPQTYFSANPDLLPLAKQITHNSTSTLEEALKANSKLAKETSSDGYSLLYFAVLNLNNTAVEQLFNAGADANQIYKSSDGQFTPLTYLISNYDKLGSAHPGDNVTLSLIGSLDKAGTKLNLPYPSDSSGVYAPIFSSVTWEGKENLLKKLVQDGADINLPGFQGQTLLYSELSAGTSKPAYIQFLLDLGADPNRKSDDGTTPADSFCDWVTTIQGRGQYNGNWQATAQQVGAILKAKGGSLSCKI